MSDQARRESPLAEFLAAPRKADPATGAGVQISERPFLGHINLRGDPSEKRFLEAVEGAIGVALPLEPNTVAEGGEISALWLGPDEWLLLTPPDRQRDVVLTLKAALGDTFAAVNDLSGGQTVVRIQGTHARDVLSKGCPLDLHPRVFGPGQCAQSHISKTMALIRQIDDTPTYDVIVRRSFADYLARWLEEAAQEYGLAVIAESPT
ncbi:MAG: sarcosine oxidase subunit gamma [Chloroflexi bacterium]|nr:sarcosine oxidase subunit gamma [Chloroflexota bacterium]